MTYAISPASARGISRKFAVAVFRFSTLFSRAKVHFHLIDGVHLGMSRDIHVTHAIARILLFLLTKMCNAASTLSASVIHKLNSFVA